MKIGVQFQPQATTVPRMRAAWRAADALGVDSIWVWDHFFPLYGEPDETHFEAYTLLAAMAADTSHAQIGALVTCYSYRNPQLLADMARTIDHISDGRFGLTLIKERLGKLNPGPVNGTLPLMIGGSGEKFTLRLVAEHATLSNVFGPVENVRHKNKVLDAWCRKIGRDPKEIERTVAINPEDLENAAAFAEAGADHLIVMTSSPYDLAEVEKFIREK
jgi:alkanesulfonate monooxygenase SsuD/methylene tetrahydromethanopterin reductase-like flavin-dependent oxidoreductase (luciferase family)